MVTTSQRERAILFCGIFSVPIIASYTPIATAETEDKGGFIVAGAARTTEYQGSDTYQAVPLFVSQFYWGSKKVEVAGLSTSIELASSKHWSMGLSGELDFGRDSDVDNAAVALLDDIDATFNVGAFFGYQTRDLFQENDEFTARVSLYSDTGDAHKDQYLTAEIDYTLALNIPWRMSIGMTSSYAGEKYMQTYFGIDAENSRVAQLSEFTASSGIRDISLSSNITYFFNRNWGIFSRLGLTQLQSDAADSPISQAGDPNAYFIGLGTFYRF